MASPVRVILCGVSFRLESDAAWRVASELARRLDARLVIAHVAENKEAIDAARERLLAHLSATAARVTVVAGHPAHELARIARVEGADLILIGAHHGKTPLLAVSTGPRLAELAPCPVVTVARAEDADRLFHLLQGSEGPTLHCSVCGRTAGSRVCPSCQQRISVEAMRHTWHPEGSDTRGLYSSPTAARAFAAPALAPSRPAPPPAPSPSPPERPALLARLRRH